MTEISRAGLRPGQPDNHRPAENRLAENRLGENRLGEAGAAERIRSAGRAGAVERASQAGSSDRVELSPRAETHARFMAVLRAMPEVRADKVAAAREAIEDPNYVTDEKLDIALDRLLDEIQSGDA